MKSIPFLLLAAVLFVSCGDSSTPESSYVPLKQVIGTQTPTTNTSTTPSFVADTTNLTPGEPVTVTPNNTSSVKLNPPHGQPGHRCDIPDGAPLPTTQPVSLPQTQVQTQTQAPPTVTQIQPTVVTTPTKTAKGMNPPHGEPGHRCDIAVGAPLNSKPTTTTTTPPTTVSTTPTKTAPGMNPPHGEAGHRCDLAVGAPLPKTDAKTDSKKEENAIIPVKNEVKDSTKQ